MLCPVHKSIGWPWSWSKQRKLIPASNTFCLNYHLVLPIEYYEMAIHPDLLSRNLIGWSSGRIAPMYESHNVISLPCQMKLILRDKNADLTGVWSCRTTLLQCLRQNHLTRNTFLWCAVTSLIYCFFETLAGTDDLLSRYALGILSQIFKATIIQCDLSPQFFCIDATLLCKFESDKIWINEFE